MDVTASDAAFGPQGMGSAESLGAAQLSPEHVANLVKELQQLLNMRGYGPVQVTGTLDEATKAAARSANIDLNTVSINRAIELLKAPALAPPPTGPWYKQPKYLLAGAAVLGVVGYIAWRAGALKQLGLGDGSVEQSDDKLPDTLPHAKQVSGTVTRRRPAKQKCEVLPSNEGEVLEPPKE